MPKLPPPLVDGKPIDYSGLPERLRKGMERYLIQGITPGSFLKAIITNDLKGAVLGADDQNILLLRDIVRWFHNYTPPESHGSYDLMDHWSRSRSASRNAEISQVMTEMGRKGGKIGGKRRAERMTPEERSESASKAARIRWGKD